MVREIVQGKDHTQAALPGGDHEVLGQPVTAVRQEQVGLEAGHNIVEQTQESGPFSLGGRLGRRRHFGSEHGHRHAFLNQMEEGIRWNSVRGPLDGLEAKGLLVQELFQSGRVLEVLLRATKDTAGPAPGGQAFQEIAGG